MGSQLMLKVRGLLDALEGTTGEPGDLASTLRHIAQTAKTFFAADACVIFAINPITNQFIGSLTVASNLLKRDNLSYKQPRQEGIAPQVLKRGVLLVEDLAAAPEYHSIFTRSEGIRSFAGLALHMKHSQRPLGVLYLNFRQQQQFGTDDLELFQFFTDQASFILQETWLLRRYQAVARIGEEINQELATVDTLFQKLQKHVGDILDISYTLLLATYQPQKNALNLYMQEEGRFILRENDALEAACQYVMETQETLFIRQVTKEAEHLPFPIASIPGTEPKESFIFVPLVLRDAPLGALSIQHPQPNAYNQEDIFILQLLASHIALALRSIRLFKSLSQLNETGQLLTQHLESEQTLQATVDKIRDATKADVVVLYPYEPAHHHFVPPPRVAGKLLDPSSRESMSSSRSDDLAKLMLHHVQPIFAEKGTTIYSDLHGHTHIRQGSFGQREKIRSTAAMPLRVGDELVGVLFVNFRQSQHFDATQKLFIEGLAHYAAIAIKNSQVFGRLSQRRMHELEILQYIDRELSRNLELKSVLNTLLKLAHEQVPAEEASILLYNTRIQALEIPAAIGPHAEASSKRIISLEEAKGITLWVLEHKKPARVFNVHRDPQWRDLYIQGAADTVSELDVPLRDGEEVVGILNFESTREGAFRQEDEDFLLTLAGQAVLAIKNAQAYEREKRLAEEGRVLNEISKQITSQLDYLHVFELIVDKALELTHSTVGELLLYDRDLNDLRVAAEHGLTEDKRGVRLGLHQGIVGYVARNKRLINADLSQPPWKKIYVEFVPGMHSELAVPLLAGDDLRGVLYVESASLNNFSDSDERLLQGLADMAVVALQNAQAYEREKRLVAEGQLLNEISKEITSQLDYVRVFDLILGKALELTHSTVGALLLYDPDLNDLRTVADRGLAEDKRGVRLGLNEGIVGHVVRNKQLVNADLSQPAWKEIYVDLDPGNKMRSELAVPMLAGDEVLGVLNVESAVPHNFNERDGRLLQGLADLAVVALQNAERYKQAKQEAQRFELLYQAAQELGRIGELTQLEQTYDIIRYIVEKYCDGQVAIHHYEDETQELVAIRALHHQYSPPFLSMKLDEGVNGQITRKRHAIVIYDIDRPPPGIVPAKPSDSTVRSLIIMPIVFKERYYGNLGLSHKEVGYFRDADVHFLEGLTQQLASTIYRLETAQERQEFKQRAISAEAMSSIGQIAFELTHRWGNDLGLVRSYVNDIQSELKVLDVKSTFLSEKLENIVRAARTVLDLSKELKQVLVRSGEAIAGEPVVIQSRAITDEPIVIQPGILLEEAQEVLSLPSIVSLCLEIDDDVAPVRVIHSSVADILRNLVANAIDAMPEGGKITLRARNVGRSVALEVTDTGVGISRQSLSKIFDLFYSTKGSSGFGLWSARTNALRNHGDLTVKSQEGQGTTFTLLLPKVEGETS